MIPHNAQLSALEPSWASRYTEAELRGLLVMASLFNEKLYIHDTQLVDHTTLLGSYLRHVDDDMALFRLVYDLIDAGIIRVCLRDSVFIRREEKEIPVSGLSQLHEVLSQRSTLGWIPPEHYQDRGLMMTTFDKVISVTPPIRYSYRNIKESYIDTVRDLANRPDTEHYRFLSQMPSSFREQYDALIQQEWFSFIDIIDLCAPFGLRQDSELVQSHGLVDEICYAEWNRSRMLASNSATWLTENDVAPVRASFSPKVETPVIYVGSEPSLLPEFQNQMLATIESPGLSLLGSLSVEDIVALRAGARDTFQLRVVQGEEFQGLQRRLAESILRYWDRICTHIRITKPALATDRTRIAVFLRQHLPTLTQWGSTAATFALELGLDTLGVFLPGLAVSDSLRHRVHDALSLRFLFYGDAGGLKTLRNCIPAESWLLEKARKSKVE